MGIKAGEMAKPNSLRIFLQGVKNYRMWCMVATYGFCFGVELTMNNIIAPYLFDQFNLNIQIAGVLGSCFGLMNLFARSLGGLASDITAAKYGMRGRLWALWIMQTLEGALCIVMGRLYMTLPGTLVVMIMFSRADVRGSVLRRGALHLQEIPGNLLWLHRRGRKRRQQHHPGHLLQGSLLHSGRNQLHGRHDHRRHASGHPHLLPHVGRHVLRPKGGRHRVRLLPRRLHRGGEGRRHRSFCRQVRQGGRLGARRRAPPRGDEGEGGEGCLPRDCSLSDPPLSNEERLRAWVIFAGLQEPKPNFHSKRTEQKNFQYTELSSAKKKKKKKKKS